MTGPARPSPLRTVLLAAVFLMPASLAQRADATTLEAVVRSALADFPAIRVAQANRSVAEFRIEEASARHLPVFELGGAARVAGAASSSALPRARLNLWSGGAIESTIDRERQRAASAERREAVAREEVAFGAALAYLRVLRGWRLVRVTEANLARHERLAALFEDIVRIDAGRRFDLVQAQARVQFVRGTLEDRLAELGSARQALARFHPQPIAPDTLSLPAVAALPAEPAEAPLQDHPAVAAARLEVQAAEANARTLRLSRGPRLDLEATGGRDPASLLVLSWPAFDATLTAAERAAVAARLGAEATLQDVEQTVRETLRQAEQDFASAGRRLAQAERQVTLTGELVGIYFEQFQVGRRNLLDLLTAYAELSNAEAAVAGSQVDQALARYRMQFAAGTLVAALDGPLASLPVVAEPEPVQVPPFVPAVPGIR